MDNNTYTVKINTLSLPSLLDCDILTASEAFVHMDRIADFNVLLYVLDGYIFVTEDTNDYEVAPGCMLLLRQGVRHFGKRPVPKGTRWFYAHFTSPETSLPELDGDSPYGEFSLTVPKQLSGLSGSQAEAKLVSLGERFRSGGRLMGWQKNALLFEVLSLLTLEEVTRPRTLSERICGFLSEHTGEPFTRQLLEGHFFLSYSYMAAVFRREMGCTPGRYHDGLRMKEACRLLRSTAMAVGEVAGAVGFSDVLYFSRRFRELTGETPTAYRRRAKESY